MGSQITITGCDVRDGLGLAYNNMSAFWQDSNWSKSWRHTTLQKLIIEQGKAYPKILLKDRKTTRHQKAVDASSGKLVGYARWKLPESLAVLDDGLFAWADAMTPDVSDEEQAEINRIAESADCEPQASEADSEFDRNMFMTTNKWLESRPFFNLDYLCVAPDQQGRGIGSALIQSGLQQARTLGLDAFVFAYQGGISLYARHGFQVVEELVAKISGSEEPYRVCYMVYEHNRVEK